MFPLRRHTVVGRGPDADLRFSQSFISSRQCTIEMSAAADPSEAQGSTAPMPDSASPPVVWLTDESKYGTYVNGTRAAGQTELHEGDKVSFGEPEKAIVANGGHSQDKCSASHRLHVQPEWGHLAEAMILAAAKRSRGRQDRLGDRQDLLGGRQDGEIGELRL